MKNIKVKEVIVFGSLTDIASFTEWSEASRIRYEISDCRFLEGKEINTR